MTAQSNTETAPSSMVGRCRPLTAVVHKALMALGKANAILPEERLKSHSPGSPLPNRGFAQAYENAALLLLVGIEFDMESDFVQLMEHNSENGDSTGKGPQGKLMDMFRSLPTGGMNWDSDSDSDGLDPAEAVYYKEVGVKPPDLDKDSSWKNLKETTMDRLSRNVQSLVWCNKVWRKLISTGTGERDAAPLFWSLVSTGMKLRCPVQEFPSHWFSPGPPRTEDELKVMALSASIREDPEWRQKLNDESIISVWRKKAYSNDFTSSMFDFLIAELDWLAKQLDKTTGIDYTAVPGVFTTDNLISHEDRNSLRTGVDAIMITSDKHPIQTSGFTEPEQVLNIVDPSLYPYVRGRTRHLVLERTSRSVPPNPKEISDNMDIVAASILQFLHPSLPPKPFQTPMDMLGMMGQGTAASHLQPHTGNDEHKWLDHPNYQWLPVDVEVSAGPAPAVRLLSYINNLHPSPETPGGALYPLLERILACFVPLFECTLRETRCKRVGCLTARTAFLPWPTIDNGKYWKPRKPTIAGVKADNPEWSEDEIRSSQSLLWSDWFEERTFLRPIVKKFVPPKAAGPADVTLSGRTLQVIVKVASVRLTPEQPEYLGGEHAERHWHTKGQGEEWHVSGINSEKIVSTGMYFFESENIGESSLHFRQLVEQPQYVENDPQHFEYLFEMASDVGTAASRNANQALGGVKTLEGRCICFPNNLQHHLSGFRLEDPTKPGHMKFLVFYLVDPDQHILSTSNVPPQQLEWFLREICLQSGTRLSTLPPELFNMVSDYFRTLTDANQDESIWLMSPSEAKQRLLKLIEERSAIHDLVDEQYTTEFEWYDQEAYR